MDTAMRTTSVQQRTPTKKTKPRKKNTPHPVKVVYISNPMKIKASASEFRALVQELTGQDAQSPPDPTRLHALDSSDDSSSDKVTNVDDHVLPLPQDPNDSVQHQQLLQQQPSSSFEALDDDVFTPQMIESISSLLPPSLFYESPHLNHWALGCGVLDALGMCMVASLILTFLGRVLHRGSSGGFFSLPLWMDK
ncbi:unnamed protein product [Sphenostylis stenocarpa]|uniref:VQ domain-containing protein n=1 Tax=Sphenostylis stenocarpa TaxID=92480 RepID=A0AA86VAU4_9FABA|nr:unnamed protein product [Sphenostylis stenocarpa]